MHKLKLVALKARGRASVRPAARHAGRLAGHGAALCLVASQPLPL